MTWVKICGITNLDDALMAIEAGADALGFVFHRQSPRYVDPETAGAILQKLPKDVDKVGVVVDDGKNDWRNFISELELTAVQQQHSRGNFAALQVAEPLPGDSSQAQFAVFHSLPASSFLMDEGSSQQLAEAFSRVIDLVSGRSTLGEGFQTFFLDSGEPSRPGGTGKPFDWKRAVPIAEEMRKAGLRLVVSGGLTPDNVQHAMRILEPWGVDVCSGVEAQPGKKHPQKIRAFLNAVHNADRAIANH
jgi:phosphoribosylanthranilate isomerase